MSANDDGDDDLGRTVILPNPGGRRAASAPAPAPRPDPGLQTAIQEVGVNPLAAAAAPLLALAARLRNTPTQSDVPALRNRVIREMQDFEKRALAAGVPDESVRAARYALAATIDDVVQNTPWGQHSEWPRYNLVSTLFNDVTGGKRFFDILGNLEKDPTRYRDVLELMFLCISLGFEGKFRLEARGPAELEQVRDRLFRVIRQQRGEFERSLSPHWEGVQAQHRPLSAALPLWLIALATAVLLTGLYAGFSWALNSESDAVFAELADLPPTGEVRLARAAPPPPPAPVARPEQMARIKKFLEPEIAEGLVTVLEDNQAVTVRLRNDGMFDSGKAEVSQRFLPILARIGEALDVEQGKILITGHTDNVPIHTLRFPSNWHLSVARAEAVRKVIDDHVRDDGRITVEGRAAAEPIAPNNTADGRAQNRRIEVMLMKRDEPAGAGR